MSNIKEIAKAAGVSTSTVSRVLNNNPLISAETREHVLRIIREHDYVPNSFARGLSSQRAFAVALLVDIEDEKSFDNLFFHKIMYGIESVLYQNDLSLVVCNMQSAKDSKNRLSRLVQGKHVQGVILPSILLSPDLLKILKTLDVPFVVFGEPEDEAVPLDWVDINNAQGSRQAVAHLLEAGYGRIAYLSGCTHSLFNKNRLAGYRAALEGHGLPVDEALITSCDGSKDGAYAAMSKLLSLATPPDAGRIPDAVICGDNVISMGAMKAAAEKGLHIPCDFGVVSFDDYPIAELVEPSLTTVDIDVHHMGAEAAKLMLGLMEGPAARHQASLISTSIRVRESTNR